VLHREPVEVAVMVERACETAQPLIDAHRHQLSKLLLRLPTQDREVLVLAYQEGLGYDQIGKIIGKSPASAKVMAWRAIQKARRMAGERA